MKTVAAALAVLAISLNAEFPAFADGSSAVVPAQGGYVPPKPKRGFSYPDCFCTDSTGQRVEVGQTSCLQIGSTQVYARCGMSLNSPAWRQISQGCPTS